LEVTLKTIIVGNTNGLKRGKTAIATSLTRADTWRVGDSWHGTQDLTHDTAVDEVNHFGRHTTARGEVLRVESLDGPAVTVRILDIRAVEPDRLTETDFRALGYRDKADYASDWGEVMGDKIWLMRIEQMR
jgi:hypothetical protein